MVYQKNLTREMTAEGLEKLKAEGMEIYQPTEAEMAQFREKTKAAFDKWAEKADPEVVKIFQEAIQQ